MKRIAIIVLLVTVLFNISVSSQTIYVDANKGHDHGTGAIDDPLLNFENAIIRAQNFPGIEPVIIKMFPGLYMLQDKAIIRTANPAGNTIHFIVEAVIMPGDTNWLPDKMPVISSVSPNNSTSQFKHAEGILIARNNVTIRGIKFVGDQNPQVGYYYPLRREDEHLGGLEISQCYFVGEKNSSAIQGAIWAHGAGIQVDHCIFYNCKNALLLFRSISKLSVTHSIIIGAYEAAVWFGPFQSPFEFTNNIITGCEWFWLGPEKSAPAYHFNHSIITANNNYIGMYSKNGPVVTTDNHHIETDIKKSAKIILNEVKTSGIPRDYLNLSPESDGKELQAGIFK